MPVDHQGLGCKQSICHCPIKDKAVNIALFLKFIFVKSVVYLPSFCLSAEDSGCSIDVIFSMMLWVSCFLTSVTANLIVFSLVLDVDWYALLSVVLTDSIAMVTSGEVVVVRGIVVVVSGIAVVTLWHVISWVVEPLNVVKEPLGHLCLIEGLKAITLVYSSKHTKFWEISFKWCECIFAI